MPESNAINPPNIAITGATVYGRFNDFVSDEELADGTPFTRTAVNTTIPSTVNNAKYGVITITHAGAEDDGLQLQDERETFRTDEAKEFTIFACRCDFDRAEQNDIFMGLSVLDTAFLASNPADFIGFLKDDGDAQIDVICTRNSASTRQNNVARLDTGTHEYAFVVEPDADDSPNATICFYIDGKLVWKFVPTATLASNESQCDDNPHDEELSRTWAYLAGAAAADVNLLDYIGAWHVCPDGRAPSL